MSLVSKGLEEEISFDLLPEKVSKRVTISGVHSDQTIEKALLLFRLHVHTDSTGGPRYPRCYSLFWYLWDILWTQPPRITRATVFQEKDIDVEVKQCLLLIFAKLVKKVLF